MEQPAPVLEAIMLCERVLHEAQAEAQARQEAELEKARREAERRRR